MRGTHVLSSAKGVRIAKENELERGTHILSSAKGGTSWDSEESQRMTGTYLLSSEGGTGQVNERKPANDEHLHAVEQRRDGSGQQKKTSE